jgi:hypothetical protein
MSDYQHVYPSCVRSKPGDALFNWVLPFQDQSMNKRNVGPQIASLCIDRLARSSYLRSLPAQVGMHAWPHPSPVHAWR